MVNYLSADIMLFKCHILKYVILLWKKKMAIEIEGGCQSYVLKEKKWLE